jgi:monoamine oxidase
MAKTKLPDYDIAIIGGGASGLYTAWRMLLDGQEHSESLRKWTKARGKLKIAIFEGSDRIGGRLLSAKSPALPDTVCELGGMRYVSSQTYVRSIVENKFNLPRHELIVTDEKNLAYLRGKHLRISDLGEPDKLPYSFSPEEKAWLSKKNNAISNLLGYAIEKIFPEIATKNLSGDKLRKYLEKQKIDGKLLYKHGFWNLVSSQLSHEGYRAAVTTVGYDCLGFNINAVDAICEYYDFTPGVKYYLFDKGFDSLLWTIQDEFQKAGGEVISDKWLTGFDQVSLPDRSKGVALNFRGDRKTYSARAIVLAMPKRSIELLEERGPVLDPAKSPRMRHLMNAVEPIICYKMFIAYDHPWWEKKGVTEGRTLTDIPVRQCYYWGVDKDTKNAIIMAYNDAQSSQFWGGLRFMPLGPGDTKDQASSAKFKRTAVAKANTGKANDWEKRLFKNWKNHEAPKAMVKEMHRQLTLIHNMPDAPEPIDAAFQDWGDDPFGGAVHFWNPGYNSTKTMHEISHPVPNFPCYVCGEAYSQGQTWVEGAIQTSEIILRKFGIPEPKWLTKNPK